MRREKEEKRERRGERRGERGEREGKDRLWQLFETKSWMDNRKSTVNPEQALLPVALGENWAFRHILKICEMKESCEILVSIKEHPEEFYLRIEKGLKG